MIHPLVIAPHFLASNNTNGQLERLFFTHLPETYEPYIIAKREFSDIQTNALSNFSEVSGSRLISVVQSISDHLGLFRQTNLPDRERLNWNHRVYAFLKNKNVAKDFDYIHTISMPCSSHLIGHYVKSKYKLPWVAQFYDPWTDNGMRSFRNGRLIRKDSEYEQVVAENANIIIVPDEALKQSWILRYGQIVENKIFVLPFVADTSNLYLKPDSSHNGFVISHIGGLNDKRNTLTFLKAISILKQRNAQLLDALQINYVGSITSKELNYIYQEGLEDYVNVVGRIPEERCVDYYIKSDLFLIVDVDCTPNLFYPSKIIKYFCYQKPILGIVKPNSTLQKELSRTHNYPFDYDDCDSVALFIENALKNYSSICNNDKVYWKRFDVDKVVADYALIINGLC